MNLTTPSPVAPPAAPLNFADPVAGYVVRDGDAFRFDAR